MLQARQEGEIMDRLHGHVDAIQKKKTHYLISVMCVSVRMAV